MEAMIAMPYDADGADNGGHDPVLETLPADRNEPDPFLSPKYGGTEIYLIRHADAIPEAEDLRPGDYDSQNLSALGSKQAAALAERLRTTRFDALYASPLGRARQTAEPVAAALGVAVETVPDLREIALGPIGPALPEGATPTEMAAHLRDRLRAIALTAASTGRWSSIPGSEPSAAFRARVVNAHDQLAVRHPGGRIACFSHGGTINVYAAAVLALDRDFFFPVANTAISIVRVKGDQRVLVALNDVCHLREAGLLNIPE
jgi:broad specificity phosphatase PhoE